VRVCSCPLCIINCLWLRPRNTRISIQHVGSSYRRRFHSRRALRIQPPLKGALQLLINRYGSIRFAHVHERVSTTSFVVLILGNSESNHLGAQGTFQGPVQPPVQGPVHGHLQGPVLACTRYCHYQYCMVYSIQREGRGEVIYGANVAQSYCSSVGNANGRE